MVGEINQSTASKQLYHSSWRGTLKTTTFIIRGEIKLKILNEFSEMKGWLKK